MRRVLALACVLAGMPVVSGTGQPGRSSAITDLITSYADWVQGRRTGVELIAIDLDAARGILSRFDPSSLPTTAQAGTPAAREDDRALVYLAHLFRGIALENRGRLQDARLSYREALAESPGAHSATLRLAALEFRHGGLDEPESLLGPLLRDDDPRRDPWWSYYAGDWRFWYPRIERVRSLLKS
jgi:hypothetical protein